MGASADAQAHGRANVRGMAAMSLAMAAFLLNDALVKRVSESLPTAQLIFVRGCMATLLLLALSWATGQLRSRGSIASLVQPRVFQRSVFDALATLTYLTSLFNLPIGNATAINMATPLVITLLAVALLGERVGWAQWLAIGTGFVGVLLIVQPSGAGFNVYALLCLAGTVLHAARDITTRTIPASVPSLLITLSTALVVTFLAGVWSLLQPWVGMTWGQLGLLAAASVFLCAGYFLLITGTRSGDMGVIAPFRYTAILYALLLGWLFWGDVPNALALAGIALLVSAGVYVLLSERRRAHLAREALACSTD